MTNNGEIVAKRAYPSPNPAIRLFEITYLSQGLRVKGLLAEPKAEGTYDGFLYLRGGMQGIGMVRPSRIAQFAKTGVYCFCTVIPWQSRWGRTRRVCRRRSL